MATSLNGWPAIKSSTDSRLAWGTVPGTKKKVRLHKDVLPVFLAMLSDINKTIIKLDPGPLDGWEYREARLGGGFSNHSSATACDFRYDFLKATHKIYLTPAQHNAMHKLMDKYVTSSGKRVFGWGGDWTPGKAADEMHLESIQEWSPGSKGSNATAADFQNVAKRLGIKPNGTIGVVQGVINTVKPSPIPTIYAVRVISAAKTDPKLPAGKTTFAGNVKIVEAALAAEKLLDPKYVDGAFGTKTVESYAVWQKKCGIKNATGIPDVVSLKKLGSLHSFKVV